MIPVYQDKFGKPEGNCFAACVASILELSLHDIRGWASAYTAFCTRIEKGEAEEEDESWWLTFQEFLDPLGYHAVWFADPWNAPVGWAIAQGHGPRGLDHSVIVNSGELVHDPHPKNGGLIKIEGYVVIHRCVRRERLELKGYLVPNTPTESSG
jgi:hypothetical protein